jgi:hypothetical protein
MLRFITLVTVACAGALAGAQTIFYGGDPDYVNALVSGTNLAGGGTAMTYDDFMLSGTEDIGAIFGNFFVDPNYHTASITQAYYEIRTGMSDGNGGTVVASGTVAASAADPAGQALGLQQFTITAAMNLTLGAGTYWVTLAPVGNGLGSIFVATTHGVNGIGMPLADGDSFYNATSVYSNNSGHVFETTSDELGGNVGDFSYGLDLLPSTPEPASLAILGIGVAGLIRRRCRRPAH